MMRFPLHCMGGYISMEKVLTMLCCRRLHVAVPPKHVACRGKIVTVYIFPNGCALRSCRSDTEGAWEARESAGAVPSRERLVR